MPKNTLSPFEGEPLTLISEAEDVYTVVVSAIAPLRAKIADRATWLIFIVSLLAACWKIIHGGSLNWPSVLFWCVTVAATTLAGRFALYRILRRRFAVVFNVEAITVESFFRSKAYDRNLSHKFILQGDYRADREADNISFREQTRRRRWWSRATKRYYGDSYRLIYEELGQNHELAIIYKHKVAKQIVQRLKAVDKVMDGLEAGNSGYALTPDADWADQAGGL